MKLTDLFEGIPITGVLRERLALAQQRVDVLAERNAVLESKVEVKDEQIRELQEQYGELKDRFEILESRHRALTSVVLEDADMRVLDLAVIKRSLDEETVAAQLRISESEAQHSISRLLRKGYLEVVGVSGRGRTLCITDAGLDALAESTPPKR